jgi:hypothetical protein
MKIFRGHRAELDEAAAGLTRAERETLIRLLKQAGKTAEESLEPPELEPMRTAPSRRARRSR